MFIRLKQSVHSVRAGGAYSLACIFVALDYFSLKTKFNKSLKVENCLIPFMLDFFLQFAHSLMLPS